jgi:hypothetical protein
MAYIGSTPTTQSFISGTDYFNGTGSQTSFTLSRPVGSVNDIQAVVNNVVQVPNDAYNVSGTSIVFTSAPSAGTGNVYVRYMSTTTQSITPSQNTVSYATWDNDLRNETFAFKNRVINGDMTIDQRNNGASVNATDSSYAVDRFPLRTSQSGKYTAQQNAGGVTPPAGFRNYLGINSITSYSPVSGDYIGVQHKIEGYNVADFNLGNSSAVTWTLSFWVRSSLTGTFAGSFRNSAQDRSYVFTYTINAANTWEQKSITVPGDTTGTWLTTNGMGLDIWFNLGSGSANATTAGSWVSGGFLTATGSVNVVATNGATWYVTGVQLEKGFTATNFDVLPYGTELALCQRYYETSYNYGNTAYAVPTNNPLGSYVFLKSGTNTIAGGVGTAQETMGPCFYKVPKRANPTLTIYSYTSSTTSAASNGWTGADLAASTGSVGDNFNYGFTVINKSGGNVTTGGYGIIFGFASSAEL